MAQKANHHYIQQFYLRGFAQGVKRQALVFTFDNKKGRSFSASISNIASRRHFNRVELDGFEPNALEDELAGIEDHIAPLLKETIRSRAFPTRRHFEAIMNLIALLSVRNPKRRKSIDEFHTKVIQQVMEVSTADEERWRSSVEKLKAAGQPLRDDVTYEDFRQFVESGKYEILIAQTHLINPELQMVKPVIET